MPGLGDAPIDVTVLPGFLAVILLFLIPPGPDMAYMVATGLGGGRGAAVRSILGIGTGMSLYAGAVVIGIGTVALAHPGILDVVKVLGALYLLWLAHGAFRQPVSAGPGADRSGAGGNAIRRPYLRGVIVSLANPKVMLFFVAVLPQFMGAAQNPRMQLALLSAVNVLTEVILYGAIGLMAGTFHARFARSPRSAALLNRLAGVVYLALAGIVLAETAWSLAA